MNDYDVSVITPAFNPDPELFKRAFDSMKNQTYGFDRIEWIIVVHNSDDAAWNMVQDLTKGYENIRLYRLHNDNHTASSPRNYGMPFANGEYIAFLDCDDYYATNLFSKLLPVMKSSGAEVGSFRYECISKDGLVNIFPCILLDQTRESIIVDTDDWDSSKFVYGAGMNVTSKIYLRRFIEENGFRFDESVPLAEDNLFNMNCFVKAKKIAFFPQLIGYEYWMNEGSLVQSLEKTDEQTLSYTKGVQHVLKFALSTNLFTDYVVIDLLGFISAISMASMNLTLDTRMKIRDMLAPYCNIVKKVEPGKLYSPSLAKSITMMPKIFIAKPKFCYHLMKVLKFFHVNMAAVMSKNNSH